MIWLGKIKNKIMSYLSKLDQLARDDRQMRALTGASVDEIKHITKYFDEVEQKINNQQCEQSIKRGDRKRKWGGGNKGVLDTSEKKVFFCLNYLKTYPTYDVLGHNFDLSRGAACKNTHRLIPILALTFEKLGCKPLRTIDKPEDFLDAFGDVERLIIDGIERHHFRSKNPEIQKDDYSGKKKTIPKRI